MPATRPPPDEGGFSEARLREAARSVGRLLAGGSRLLGRGLHAFAELIEPPSRPTPSPNIPGRLVLTFEDGDFAALHLAERLRGGELGPIDFIASSSEFLQSRELRRAEGVSTEAYALQVPAGTEERALEAIETTYAELGGPPVEPAASYPGLLAAQDAYVQRSNGYTGGLGSPRTQWSDAYLARMGVGPPGPEPVTVTVLDSGVDADLVDVERGCSFVGGDPFSPQPASEWLDDVGHGTGVASIISELAPTRSLWVGKLWDRKFDFSIFDVLAALESEFSEADIVNCSFSYTPGDIQSPILGRHSARSQAQMIERTIHRLATSSAKRPIIIAAAGNDAADTLTYPARCPEVIAAESVNARDVLSGFSNFGAECWDGSAHRYRFTAPGGDAARQGRHSWRPLEAARTNHLDGTPFWGTSFSAAYISGAIANLLSHRGRLDRDELLSLLVDQAQRPSGADAARHGNGLLRT